MDVHRYRYGTQNWMKIFSWKRLRYGLTEL
jgi:hypothetical protein